MHVRRALTELFCKSSYFTHICIYICMYCYIYIYVSGYSEAPRRLPKPMRNCRGGDRRWCEDRRLG